MRLVTFQDAPRGSRLGILDGDWVVEPGPTLTADALLRAGSAAAAHAPAVPEEMIAFFQAGQAGRERAQRAVEAAARQREAGNDLRDADGRSTVHALRDIRLLAPVPRPPRVRDFLSYRKHAVGSGVPVPAAFEAFPISYKCNPGTIVGPDEPLLWPSYSNQLDFELEFGFFTSTGGRDLTVDEARRRIAGVTIFNDVSARDIQMFEMELGLGPAKGKDFCSAMGPCVVTLDEVDEWSIEMSARVNGELWAQGDTGDRQFSLAEMLAWASLDEEVLPGEFFGVGTVGGGCGLELDRWIQPGDVVELEAVGIGTLRNPVAEKQRHPAGVGLATYRGAPRVRVSERHRPDSETF